MLYIVSDVGVRVHFFTSGLCATFCMWHPIAQLMHVLSGFTYWHSVVGFIICVVLQSIVSAFNVGIPFIWLYLVVLAYYARGRMRSLFQLPVSGKISTGKTMA